MRVVALLCSFVFCLSCGASPKPTPDTPETEGRKSTLNDEQTSPGTQQETASTTLNLASISWSPFTDVPGKPRIASTLVEEALRRDGVRMVAHTTADGDVTTSISEGKFDGSEALWKSAEREEYLLYSKPYLENRLVLLGRQGSDVSAQALSDLKGKRVGLVEGYAYGPEVKEAVGVQFVQLRSDEASLKALLNKELDYILVDDLMVYHMFEYEAERAQRLLVAGKHPLIFRTLHLALRKAVPGAADILSRFNKQIEEMVRSGEYNRILAVNWIAADADGDGQLELVSSGSKVGLTNPSHRYQLFGPQMTGAPRLMIEGEVYNDWASVPDMYKATGEPLDSFRPAVNAVLFEF